MRQPTPKGLVCQELLRRFPKLNTKALARKAAEDYPHLFVDYEAARTCLRYYRGATGKKDRQTTQNNYRQLQTAARRSAEALTRWGLKKTRGRKRETYQIPAAHDRVLWLSDLHIPNHDEQALVVALEYGKKKQANCVVLGGDLLDNAPFTRFRTPPDKRAARDYFDQAVDFLQALRRNFPKALIVYMEGNHDRWYQDWLIDHCAVVFDDPHYQLETRLGLEALRIPYLKEHVVVKAGKLPLLHGHTLMRGLFAPVNPARGAYLRAKHHLLFGHCHQVSTHAEKDLAGRAVQCWSTGCLCTIPPAYDPHNTKQTHGFAFIQTRRDGTFRVHNHTIVDGQIF